MRFNGVDPVSLHRAISIAKEIPPGMVKRSVYTVRGTGGEVIGGVEEEYSEYTARINIAGRDPQEAWLVRSLLAQWACSSGKNTARLEPTHWPGVFYEAICESVEPPEFKPRFATVDVRFLLPRGEAVSLTQKRERADGTLDFMIGGSREARMVVSQTMKSVVNDVTISLDGSPIARITGSVGKGEKIEIDFDEGTILIGAQHAEERADFLVTRWRPGFTPGRHTIKSSAGGDLEARWRETWS